METSLQLCYPVLTLDGEELLPAGAYLTKGTMEELTRPARERPFPAMQLMEYGYHRLGPAAHFPKAPI